MTNVLLRQNISLNTAYRSFNITNSMTFYDECRTQCQVKGFDPRGLSSIFVRVGSPPLYGTRCQTALIIAKGMLWILIRFLNSHTFSKILNVWIYARNLIRFEPKRLKREIQIIREFQMARHSFASVVSSPSMRMARRNGRRWISRSLFPQRVISEDSRHSVLIRLSQYVQIDANN